MRGSASTMALGRLPWPEPPALAQFRPEPGLDVERAVQNRGADKPFSEKQTGSAGAAPAKVLFGPFCQFLLREARRPYGCTRSGRR